MNKIKDIVLPRFYRPIAFSNKAELYKDTEVLDFLLDNVVDELEDISLNTINKFLHDSYERYCRLS